MSDYSPEATQAATALIDALKGVGQQGREAGEAFRAQLEASTDDIHLVEGVAQVAEVIAEIDEGDFVFAGQRAADEDDSDEAEAA